MRSRWLVPIVAVCLLAAACGDDDGGDDGAQGTSPPPAETDGSDAAPASEVDPEGILRVGWDLVATSSGGFRWDPVTATQPVHPEGIFHWVYGGLMRPDEEGQLVPDLAESAEVIDDTTIEVVLRPGVQFSDGQPLTAEDVKATLDRNRADPTNQAFLTAFYDLQSVEVVDDATLRLRIPNGTAISWFDLFMGRVETMPVRVDNDFTKPVGAGPMVITEYRPEQQITMEANPDYWDAENIDLAGIEVLHTGLLTDAGAANAVRAGQVDWSLVEVSSLDSVGANIESVVLPSSGRLVSFPMCKSEPPFDDERVRQAISMAIDREAITEAVYSGYAVPALTIWPAGHKYYTDEVEDIAVHDPGAARELLADAGAEDLAFDVMPFAGTTTTVAEVMQQQLAEVGVTMNIVPTANFVEDFFVNVKAPMGGIPVKSDNPRLNHWVGDEVANVCDYDDPELTEMNARLQKLPADSDEAIEIWHEIDVMFAEQVLSLFVAYESDVSIYDADRIDGVTHLRYVIPVPEIREVFVKA